MGVSASGKSTIGTELAKRLGFTYAEGDNFHSDEAQAKMAAGNPLTDEDRAPWLASIRNWISSQELAGHRTVVTCSALKRKYRDVMRAAAPGVVFVHVHPPVEVLRERIEAREGHFMPPSLLDSQLETLEELTAEEGFVLTMTDKEDILREAISRLS